MTWENKKRIFFPFMHYVCIYKYKKLYYILINNMRKNSYDVLNVRKIRL